MLLIARRHPEQAAVRADARYVAVRHSFIGARPGGGGDPRAGGAPARTKARRSRLLLLARSFSSSRSQSTISSDQPARRSRGQVELASADTDARGSACPIRKENVKAKLALRHTAYGELEGAPRQYAQKMVKTLSAYILSRFGSAATL